MAIITLLTPSTSGADSLTIINNNFTNLNSGGGSGVVQTVVAGTGITVDSTDPANPIVSSTATGNMSTSTYDPAGIAQQVAGLTATQTLTNKTLTTPTISKPAMSATNPTADTYTPTAAGTATLNLSTSNQHFIQMPAGNITIALSGDTNNQNFLVSITQDSSGSRTVTWFSTIRWAGGTPPTLTTTANKRDIFGFIRTGSGTYDGLVVGQNI